MSVDRNSSDAAQPVTTESIVLAAAARALHVPAESFAISKLAGDASTRAFYRLAYAGKTVVAVCYPWPFSIDDGSNERFDRWCEESPEDGRLTFANDPLCHVELTSLLERFEIPVPEMLAIADREGVLFVEDVGDALLQAWLRSASPGERAEAYGRAIDLIAAIRSATDTALEANTVAGRLAFDADKLGWELDYFLVNTFERFLDAPLEPEANAAVRRECGVLAAELAVLPRVLCHRDYHARNLLLRAGREPADGLVVIDFQDARMGPVTYDLVSLLEDPYAALDADFRAAMRMRFAERLRAEGSWPGEDEFREEYDVMTAQRLLKAVGTYTHHAAVRGKREYLPYIVPAAATALASLDRLARFPALREAVEKIVLSERQVTRYE